MSTALDAAVRGVERTRDYEPLHLVEALRVYGMVLSRLGRSTEAEHILEEGLALARSLPYPYAEARILEQMGRPAAALTIFRQLGAVKDAERMKERLAARSTNLAG